MARIDTLANFLTDIATAIKNKTGKTDVITPANFDTEIDSIEAGGGKYAPKFISFYYYTGTDLTEELANLDTSNITSMKNMFFETNNLTEPINFTGFDTSNVTSMESMFRRCGSTGANNFTISMVDVDTSNVTNMNYMFYTTRARNIDVSGLNTSSVTSMTYMFNNAAYISSLDLSHFDATSLTTMERAFASMSALTSLNLSNWDVPNLTNLSNLFSSSTKLTSFDVSTWKNMTGSFRFDNMFAYCSGLASAKFPSYTFDVGNVVNMFRDCTSITSIDMSGATSTTINSTANMFYNCKALMYLDIRNLHFDAVTNSSGMFTNVSADCEIIVADDTAKEWVLAIRSDFTNVKTVAELEAA